MSRKYIKLVQDFFLEERPTGATLADITLDFKISTSINKLRNHKFTTFEIIHYTVCTSFLTFAFLINPANLLIKLFVVSLFILLLLIPFTSQFFLNGLPVLTWVFFFFTSTNIPKEYRPPISVKVLPGMETILYGDNLSQIIATKTNAVFDILAWLPYGIIHFSFPFIVAGLLFLFGPPTCLRSFGLAFGYMNLTGVLIQLIFPAAPPWYKILHGLDPANYGMLGSPGGLARIDTLLHLDLYTTNFSKNSPVVFGAFPSLHSGSATMDALFLIYLFPKATGIWCCYILWLWWSTMYLTHHYFVDVIVGSTLSMVVFFIVKYTKLPVANPVYKTRWSYSKLSYFDIAKNDPISISRDIESTGFELSNLTNPVVARSRTASIRPSTASSRQRVSGPVTLPSNPVTPNSAADDSDSSPELSVFDSDIPRSISRSSNTSVESDLPVSQTVSSSSVAKTKST